MYLEIINLGRFDKNMYNKPQANTLIATDRNFINYV